MFQKSLNTPQLTAALLDVDARPLALTAPMAPMSNTSSIREMAYSLENQPAIAGSICVEAIVGTAVDTAVATNGRWTKTSKSTVFGTHRQRPKEFVL